MTTGTHLALVAVFVFVFAMAAAVPLTAAAEEWASVRDDVSADEYVMDCRRVMAYAVYRYCAEASADPDAEIRVDHQRNTISCRAYVPYDAAGWEMVPIGGDPVVMNAVLGGKLTWSVSAKAEGDCPGENIRGGVAYWRPAGLQSVRVKDVMGFGEVIKRCPAAMSVTVTGVVSARADLGVQQLPYQGPNIPTETPSFFLPAIARDEHTTTKTGKC